MTNQIDRKSVERLMSQCQIGFGGFNAIDNAHACLAECYAMLGALIDERDLLLTKVPKNSDSGRWTMSRLWRSWMSSTAEYMAARGAVMPTLLDKNGNYKQTRPFNSNDAHELFTRHWLGTDENGNRLSWAKKQADGEMVADKGRRFYAMQRHQDWMIERAINHINPRESDFADLLKRVDGMN